MSGTALLNINNLSDVDSATLSLANIGGQPQIAAAADAPLLTAPSTSGGAPGTLGAGSAGSLPISNGSTWESVTLSGDISLSGTGEVVIEALNGNPLGNTTLTPGAVLSNNGTTWSTTTISGDATLVSGGTLTVNSNVANGFPRLISDGSLQGQTLGMNFPASSNMAALLVRSSASYPASGEGVIQINEFGAGTSIGGGPFVWQPTSTATVDGGVTLCPTDRQASVSGEAHGTWSGTSMTGTLSVPQANATKTVIPGSLQISVGLSSAITDNGAGYLMYGGMPIGTINYTTGAFAINPSSLKYISYGWSTPISVTSGNAVTASYSYANSAGRLVRLFSSLAVDDAWWGSAPNIDSTAAILAADAYAFTNKLSLFIGGADTKFVSYPLGLTSAIVFGAGSSANNGISNRLYWKPVVTVDLMPCLCPFQNNQTFKDIHIVGPTSYGRSNNVQVTGSVSAGVLTVTSGSTSTFAVGQMVVSGLNGVVPVGTTIVSGSGNTWNLSNSFNASSQTFSTIATDITPLGTVTYGSFGDASIYSTLPAYNSIAVGVAGVWDGGTNSGAIFENVSVFNVKVGLVFSSGTGHTSFYRCQFAGLFGLYPMNNGASQYFFGCSLGGILANILMTDLSTCGLGANGAIYETDFYGACYVALAMTIGGTGTATIEDFLFVDCGFEAVGEAGFRLLPTSVFGPTFINCSGPGYPGSQAANNILPSNFTMSNGHAQYWIWAGTIGNFRYIGKWGNGYWPIVTVSNQTTGVVITGGVSGILAAQQWPIGDDEYIFFGNKITRVNNSGAIRSGQVLNSKYPNFFNMFTLMDPVRKNVLAEAGSVLTKSNLILPPETTGNWSLGTGTTLSTVAYSSISGAPAIAYLPPDMIQEMGTAFNVLEFTVASGDALSATINLVGTPVTVPHPRSVGYSFWALVMSSTNAPLQAVLNGPSSNTMYVGPHSINNASGYGAAGWFKIWAYGENMYQYGSQSQTSPTDQYNSLTLSTTATITAGATILIAGLMVFLDEISAYNPNPGPSLSGELYLSNQTTATSATTGSASALPTDPAIYLNVVINGTTYKIPAYNP